MSSFLTETSTILGHQSASINDSYFIQKHRWADFKALKIDQSGRVRVFVLEFTKPFQILRVRSSC